jgi:nucleoside-diphosphate-sugar epimerase
MKVFVAGGLGAIGRRLVPMLVEAGHEVAATTTSPAKKQRLFELGATPYVMNGLERESVLEAVSRAEPEVIVHEMTGLLDVLDVRNFDRAFAVTNRLRSQGTDHLLEAARVAGARRLVAQSFGNWNFGPAGTRVQTERDPLDPEPPQSMRESFAAIAHLEAALTGSDAIEGLALRYGALYGPGTGLARRGDFAELIRKRRVPVIGKGGGVWSFVHVDDAAAATVAAVEGGEPGIYNVVDDAPVRVAVWLPELASALGAPSPRHVPVWLGRLLAGEAVIAMFTLARGASNLKAKRALGWAPRYPTWRTGFRYGLEDVADTRPAERAA